MDFRILGPLEVLSDGRSLALGGPKQRILFASLLVNANRVLSTDALIDDLWGEESPDTALNTIQVYVSHLRKILASATGRGRDLLVTKKPGYVLQLEDGELDANRFEQHRVVGIQALEDGDAASASVRLRNALAMWRGDALADFSYEPFAIGEIARLEELRLATMEDQFEADLQLGRHADIVPALDSFVRRHPLRERARLRLMLALYRSGRQAEALETYQAGRAVLAEELGLDPGPEVRELQEAILRQDEGLAWTPLHETLLSTAPAGGAATAPIDGPTTALAPSEDLEHRLHDHEGLAEGEMVPLTALFADIVGSTALDGALTPAEVRAIIGECLSRMRHIIEQFGGVGQAGMGDGIAAHFGIPVPHEDDVERAARAGLRLLQAVRDYREELRRGWGIEDFTVRIGIDTGRVAVGGVEALEPSALASDHPMGAAARLGSTATPGTVVVGRALAQRLPPSFVLSPAGETPIEGGTESIGAWTLLGIESRRATAEPTPLVGREAELAELETSCGDLIEGRGQVLLIGGPPGIGKTRLVRELGLLLSDRVLWLEGRCTSYGEPRPNAAIADAFRAWAGIGETDSGIVARAKLRARLEELGEPPSTSVPAYLADLMGISADPQVERGSLDEAETTGDPRDALHHLFERLTGNQPVVLAVDDIHSADPGTIEVLHEVLSLTDRFPLMVAVAARHAPGSPGWALWTRALSDFRHRVLDLELEPLTDENAARLAELLSPTASLDDPSKEEIVSRAGGNPLYIEELVRALVSAGGLQRTKGWTLSMTQPGMALPPPLESLLTVRIQALPRGARHLAQLAAVIGREFRIGFLARLVGRTEVDESLPELLRSEIVRELHRYPELVCQFRHSLLQHAALTSITPTRSRELYREVARSLEDFDMPWARDHAERMAFYYYRSDEPERAIPYLESAARQAAEERGPEAAARLWGRLARLAERLEMFDLEGRARQEASALAGAVVTWPNRAGR